jgi:pyruvate,water dikinase
MKSSKFVLWFREIGKKDIPLVGGKNASLGEMFKNLAKKGVEVPNGFAVTVTAYKHFVKHNGIEDKLKEILTGLNTHDIKNLQTRGEKIRALFINGTFPQDLDKKIRKEYKKLGESLGVENPDVAIRSSATAEDLPDASFAGQQESYLNIEGEEAVLEHTKKAFASLFTDRAISYRHDKNFDHFAVQLSVTVQKMVRSDLSSSGVMFTCDTESGFNKVVFITGSYGLGEMVVQGAVSPDQFYVFKPSMAVIEKTLGIKDRKMIYAAVGSGKKTEIVEVIKEDRNLFVLTNEEIIKLANWAIIIEKHYKKTMDIEWAKDGKTGNLYIVQARPETIHSSKKEESSIETYLINEESKKGKLLLNGHAVGSKIGSGIVNVIETPEQIIQFKPGEVLVTDMTNPDWEPIMKIAKAIITNKGGKTCHAAIISRELGVPCVIGTLNATKILKTGMQVTVDCSTGTGDIYNGLLDFKIEKLNTTELPKTKTKVLMNIGIPEKAFMQSRIPTDGVGLAREEFIINSHIGIHPLALINYSQLESDLKAKIDEKTHGYKDKTKFFIDKLSYGVARIASAFYPNPVIVRTSDFKSNEYANLIGGHLYEPHEDNPMIGWRGASRYYDTKYKPAFSLECQALKKVRNEMGLTNMIIMIPFCRTPEEGRKVISTMQEFGLKQGENGLQIYMMVEVPSNVIMIEEFAEIFDGFSIGSNDLTQLTLGLDRDSEIVAHLFDERNEAIKKSIAKVIKVCRKKKKKIGICGQAPSDFPDFTAFLTECGISSISLNPDTIVKTRIALASMTREHGAIKETIKTTEPSLVK